MKRPARLPSPDRHGSTMIGEIILIEPMEAIAYG
jgi:hypothetical protein